MVSVTLWPALAGIALGCSACVAEPPPDVAAPPTAIPAAYQNCQQFQQTITVGGQPQQAMGLTCQQADGTWKIVAPPPSDQAGGTAVPAPPYPAYAYSPYDLYYPGYFSYPWYGSPAYLGFGYGGYGGWYGGWHGHPGWGHGNWGHGGGGHWGGGGGGHR